MLRINCPQCGAHLQFKEEHTGRQGECSNCRSRVLISRSDGHQPNDYQAEASEVPKPALADQSEPGLSILRESLANTLKNRREATLHLPFRWLFTAAKILLVFVNAYFIWVAPFYTVSAWVAPIVLIGTLACILKGTAKERDFLSFLGTTIGKTYLILIYSQISLLYLFLLAPVAVLYVAWSSLAWVWNNANDAVTMVKPKVDNADELPTCPECQSHHISALERRPGASLGGALAGGLLFGPLGAIVGGWPAPTTSVLKCLVCGHEFQPDTSALQSHTKLESATILLFLPFGIFLLSLFLLNPVYKKAFEPEGGWLEGEFNATWVVIFICGGTISIIMGILITAIANKLHSILKKRGRET